MHAQVYGFGAAAFDDDIDAYVVGISHDADGNQQHIPGQLCTENLFCEDCYS